MKRIGFIICLFLSLCIDVFAQQLDPAVREALDARIVEYFDALMGADIDVQKAEADFMIEVSADSLVRQFVALKIYDHYLESPVMGSEAVAIHVYDRWFRTGEISMGDDMDLLNARIFAEFNRQSLLGEKAPELVMESFDGDTMHLFSDTGRRHSVLFFYDAGCVKCKVETLLLKNLIETEGFPIDVYAIYAGDDRQKWAAYISDRFSVMETESQPVHLWDPTLDSDFQRKYGVVQTPRLFLVRPDGIIAGRGLDVHSLSVMLHDIFDPRELEYGSAGSEEYFDRLMAGIADSEGRVSPQDMRRVADDLMSASLQAGDTTLCRQLAGDMLYYLSGKAGEGEKEGLDYLIDKYILGRDDIWKTKDDSLKVTGFAQIMDDLLSKAALGGRMPDLKVPGELLRNGRKIKTGRFNLRSCGSAQRNIFIFYTEGCNICDAEKAAARALVASGKGAQALLVNVDRIVASDPSLANRLFNAFDLSSLPYLVETDKRGKIVRRYLTLQ
jgi:hypothetical protein